MHGAAGLADNKATSTPAETLPASNALADAKARQTGRMSKLSAILNPEVLSGWLSIVGS